MIRSLRTALALFSVASFLFAGGIAFAQRQPPRIEMPKNGKMATIVRVGNLYAQADESSERTGEVTPGRELVIVERSGNWLRVFANVDAPESRLSDQPVLEDTQAVQPISGWMLNKGVIDVDTPHGEQIMFGEAISAENAASEPHPPPRAAQDARLLYRRVVEMFPQSPIVPEAMWRAADIRWQLQRADAATLPSAHEKESYLRQQMDEDEMRKIMKYFPKTKFADFAAWDLIENQLCGDWQGSEKCPEKEAAIYQRYADERPDSIRSPQALYLAAWRMASAADMWAADGNEERAKEDRTRTMAITDHLQQKYPGSEYSARATDLAFKIQQGIAVYGSDRE